MTFHCRHEASPDEPGTETMLASMVKQWAAHYLSHLKLSSGGYRADSSGFITSEHQSGSLSSTLKSGTSCLPDTSRDSADSCEYSGQHNLPPPGVGGEGQMRRTAPGVLHSPALFRDTSADLSSGEARRAQRPPDSPLLRDGTSDSEQVAHDSHLPHQESLSACIPSDTTALFTYYLDATNVVCSLLTKEVIPPRRTSDGTYDFHVPYDCVVPEMSFTLMPTGLMLHLPPGTTGRVEFSPHSKFPDYVRVTVGLLDTSVVKEA